jgi:Glu-tRNA(Gln) amidotransferase subunit E-like FAD-binding protein
MIDYEKLKFKSGLEIHQQLDTKKLFCRCQSVLRKDAPDFVVKRKLHAVAGEKGKIDIAAMHELKKKMEFIYEGYNENTCLVELDEEPPHNINEEALKIALQISILLNAKIIPLAQIMRKIVIDGSNTSGFQRTVMIARDGFIDTSYGKVRIEGIFLEEDSARITSDKNYRLDRLGIPLVEITTYPDIKNPMQAKETALCLGDVLRSCKVKRGIGTIRQDINVSVKDNKRVEIKGFQNPKIMIKTLDNEIERQLKLIKENKLKSEVRNSLEDATTQFLRPMPGQARMYPETDLPILKISKRLIDEVKSNLPKLKSLEKKDLEKKGLNPELIKSLFKQNKLEDFKELLKIANNPNLIGKILLIFPKEISKKKNIDDIERILNKDVLSFVLEKFKLKEISESQIKEVLEKIANGESLKDAVVFKKQGNIEEKIMNLIKSKPNLSQNAYMGLVMKEFKGGISGKEAIEIIKKFI